MTAKRKRTNKTKITKILAAPLLAIGVLAGWILYYVGQKKYNKPQKTTSIPLPQDNVQLMMIPQEEQIIKE